MKTLKKGLLTLFVLILTVNLSIAQDATSTMFVVYTDYVKFNMMPQYEEAVKEMQASFTKHNIQDVNWTSIAVEDGRYVYVSPINNMAELDKDPMEGLYEKMGEEAIEKMFKKIVDCYDIYNSHIVHSVPELSYNAPDPATLASEDKNHREYHFIYYAPKNETAIAEAMKNIKAMFASKNIKNGYTVYKSGFGSPESYYMVSVASADPLEMAKNGQSNNTAFGYEGQAKFYEVIKLATRYDQVEATIRPDLSYAPKQ